MITINGKTYSGNNISISGNKVYIDGKMADNEHDKEINIIVNGNVESLDVDNCNKIQITGDCKTAKTTNGDLDIAGNISGDVSTTNGNVDCQNVHGNVSTKNGNIKHKSF